MPTKILTTLSDEQREVLDQMVATWQQQIDERIAHGEKVSRRRVAQSDLVREGLAAIASFMGLDWPNNIQWGMSEPTPDRLFPFGDIAIRFEGPGRGAKVIRMSWTSQGIIETPAVNWQELEQDAYAEVSDEPLPGVYPISDRLAERAYWEER